MSIAILLVSFLALVFLIKKIFKDDEVEVHWSRLHISIVHDYLRAIFKMCDNFVEPAYEDLFYFTFCYSKSDSSRQVRAIKAKQLSSLLKNIGDVLKVPRLNESQNQRIKKKYQLVKGFLVFLLRLLLHKPAESIIDVCKDGIDTLEKELRVLLTICVDISLMLGDDNKHEEAQNLLEEFEAVANEAGSVVHSLLFSINDRAFEKMDERLRDVLKHIDLLRANYGRRFLNRLSSSTTPTYMITPNTSVETAQVVRGHQREYLHLLLAIQWWFKDISGSLCSFFTKMFNDEVEVHWNKLHLSIVHDYLRDIFEMCDKFLEPACEEFFHFTLCYGKSDSSRQLRVIKAKKMASLSKNIQYVFKVPRLNKFHKRQNHGINKKYQLVEVFICFLLQLLYRKPTDSIVEPCKERIYNLEKELRFLPTICGDISLMVGGDEPEQAQNLLKNFEVVANVAGSIVQALLFSNDPNPAKIDEGVGVFLSHIELLKANLMRFLNRLSSTSHMITPNISVVKSFLIVDSLIHDLENLINLEEHPIADVKDQIKALHQGLLFLHSSIKDKAGSPRPSGIRELKEDLLQIGDMANRAEHLITSFLFGEAPLWYLINRLNDINCRIQLIGTELSLQTMKKLEVDDATIGLEDKATHVLDPLLGGMKSLQVISIFGMPGLGKTTLAKKLYNHSSVKYWFDKLSWCVISQTYKRKSTMANILIQIASQLEKDSILEMEEESLVEHIYKTLKGRRYLIVMDDIWDSNEWNDLQRCFPNDRNGSRILFTTRNKDVAVAPPNSIVYALPSLTDDQCWEVLKKKVFENKPCPPKLLGIGKKIAANCGGLPLAVVVIAGILSHMDKEKSTWKGVNKNLSSYIFDDGDDTVMQILELSYKHLPEYLKPCFLYFGVFKEDKEIPIGDLTRLWIGEGFVHKEVGRSAENVAEAYLKELINKSLVMVTKRRSDGGVRTCVIHDLLHDLCLKILKEENFLKFVNDMENFEDRDYSTYEKGHRLQAVLEEYVSWKYCDYVGSLHFIKYPISPMFYFRHSRFLRLLHCSYLDTHFFEKEYVVCLRYLVVGKLPAKIDSLVNLEYLVVDTLTTVEITPAILKMKKLRYIHVGFEAIYGIDCINSSQTNNLEFLSRVVICGPTDEKMLKCSPHLRKLKLSTHQHLDLSFLNQLESLNVEFTGSKRLEISFPSNIKKLTLCGQFRMCVENMSTIGRLEKLEVLKLESCVFEEDERWDTRDGEFQELIFLKLDKIKNLIEWNVDSSQHFPKLERLILRNCYNLEEIPGEIGEITTLEMIDVQGQCPESLVESAKSIRQQQLDLGNEELRVIISV